MGAAPHRKQGPRGDPGTICRDVAGRVPDAKDEDALPGKSLRSAVGMGVNLLAGKAVGTWKGWLGITRIPVMTVCHQHGAVPLGILRPGIPLQDRDIPASSGCRLCPGHLAPEPDIPAETKMIDKVIKVTNDQIVTGVIWIIIRHRE